MNLKEVTSVDLFNELIERARNQDMHMVKTETINALTGALEIVVINRWADQVSYPTIELD